MAEGGERTARQTTRHHLGGNRPRRHSAPPVRAAPKGPRPPGMDGPHSPLPCRVVRVSTPACPPLRRARDPHAPGRWSGFLCRSVLAGGRGSGRRRSSRRVPRAGGAERRWCPGGVVVSSRWGGAVSASGPYADAAKEPGPRRRLGVMAGEAGVSSVGGSSRHLGGSRGWRAAPSLSRGGGGGWHADGIVAERRPPQDGPGVFHPFEGYRPGQGHPHHARHMSSSPRTGRSAPCAPYIHTA